MWRLKYLIPIVLVLFIPFTSASDEFGWTLRNNGTIFDMWNTPPAYINSTIHYYFNASTGTQFTNDKDGAWTRNTFCGGYGTDWDLSNWNYRCTDEFNYSWTLVNTSKEINVTGLRNDTIAGRGITYVVRYSLGINDSNLTIQPFIKHRTGPAVPNTVMVGFLWKVNEIDIGLDNQTDHFIIDDTYYGMDTNFSVLENNLTTKRYDLEDEDEYLWIAWKPNNYWLQANNESVKLLIYFYGLGVGELKTTKMEWLDAFKCNWNCLFPEPFGNLNVSVGDTFKQNATITKYVGICPISGQVTAEVQTASNGYTTMGFGTNVSMDTTNPFTAYEGTMYQWNDVAEVEGDHYIRLKCVYNSQTKYNGPLLINTTSAEITSCEYENIASSTTLSADNTSCFNITADNVVFDCAGYNLNGSGQQLDYTFTAEHQDNITVKNCNFYNYTNLFFSVQNNNTLWQNNTLHYGEKVTETRSWMRIMHYYQNINQTLINNTFTNVFTNNSADEVLSDDKTVCALYINESNHTSMNGNTWQNLSGTFVESDEGFPVRRTQSYVYCYRGDSDYQMAYNDTVRQIVSNPFLFSNDVDYVDFNYSFFDNVTSGLSVSGTNFTFVGNFFNISGRIYINADDFVFDGNTMIADPSYGLDAEIIDINSNHVNITNNYIDCSNAYAGIGTGLPNNVYIINNTINNSEGQFGEHSGIYINTGTAWVLNNTVENFNMTGAQGGGISWFSSSAEVHGNTIRNGINGPSIMVLASGSVFENNTIINSSDYDIEMGFSSNTGVNNVFNKSNVKATSTKSYTNKYYLIANITNQTGGLISGATVNGYNNNGTLVDTGITNSTGQAILIMTEYIQKDDVNYTEGCTGGPPSDFNCSVPLNITANVSTDINHTITYLPYITTVNISINITSEVVDPCACPGSGNNWEVDLSEYCIIDAHCDIGTGNLSFTNSGNFTINNSIIVNVSNIDLTNSTIIYLKPNSILNLE